MLDTSTVQIHRKKEGGSLQTRDSPHRHSAALSKRQGGWRNTRVGPVLKSATELGSRTFSNIKMDSMAIFGHLKKEGGSLAYRTPW